MAGRVPGVALLNDVKMGARHSPGRTRPTNINNCSAPRSRCHTPTGRLDASYGQLVGRQLPASLLWAAALP